MRRIVIAGFQHETNCFGATLADMHAFEMADSWPPLLRAADVISGTKGSTLPLAGFARAASQHDAFELHPVLWCSAEPSSYVTDDAYDQISGEILAGVRQAGPVVGIYLDLHGAMVTESEPDGEGRLLARLRAVVGPQLPIVISLDMHANITAEMVMHADAITMFRTYPHLDMAEAGERAFEALCYLMDGGRLHKAFRHLPYMIPLHAQNTDKAPCDQIYAAVKDSGGFPDGWAEWAVGFPSADIHDAGPCLLVYDKDPDRVLPRLQALHDLVLDAEPLFDCKLWSASEAAERAMELETPVILADVQDNAGAGGASDNAEILAALAGVGASRALLGMINDPQSAAMAHDAGVGACFTGRVGGGTGCNATQFEATFEVMALSDGVFDFTGEMYRGCRANAGLTAWLRVQNSNVLDLVVSSIRCQALDQAVFTHLGIALGDYAIVSVKSTVHYLADFGAMAKHCLPVASDSLVVCDLTAVTFRNLRHGVRLGPGGPPHSASKPSG